MSQFDWNEFNTSGDFVSFKEIGDKVVGEVIAVRKAQDFNGNPCPELVIRTDDGEDRIVTAGQVMLKSALAEKQPQIGARIAIVYSGVGEAKPGKAPAKQFTVEVKGAEPAVDAASLI